MNYKRVVHALADDVTASGGEIQLGWRLIHLKGGILDLERASVTDTLEQRKLVARYVITCGGLHSDIIARMTGAR